MFAVGHKITRLPLSRHPDGILHYFIAGDWHDFHCHEESVSIMIQHAKMFKKSDRRLIINGDFNDFPEFMDRAGALRRAARDVDEIEDFFIPAAEKGAAWANEMLDRLQKVFSEIVYVEGNHDWRLNNFRNYIPSRYHRDFDIKRLLKLSERDIKFVPYNHWLDVGNVSITHGMYHGTTACKKHYEAAGRSVIFSHVHQHEVKSFTRRGETVTSTSLPCMSTLAPEYIKGRENNWTNGYGLLSVKRNGNFNFNVFTVWDDELILDNGKVLKG